MKASVIQTGAEAVLIRKGTLVLKQRVPKGYRLKELDEKLRKSRTRGEAKLLEKAGKIIFVPRVMKVDERKMEIDLEFIDGQKLSEYLDELKNWKEVCLMIGENIARLHDAGLIHGDLTTSNMIYVDGQTSVSDNKVGRAVSRGARLNGLNDIPLCSTTLPHRGKVYFIDFGLGFHSDKTEDKAVDLHLIKQALEAKHFKRFEDYFNLVLKGYALSKNFNEVMKRFEKVELRGRYRAQF